jgi:RNA polymerase sigma factor (sigma-70 family)
MIETETQEGTTTPLVFEDIFRDHFAGVANAAAFVARDAGTGQELAQEAFIRLLRRWPDMGSQEQARNFLYRVAINLARSHLRKHLRVSLWGWGHTTTDVPDHAEITAAWITVVEALGSLSARQRACVVLADYADLDSDEIGRILSMRAGTVRVHLTRARRTLKERLSDDTEDR